MYELLQDYDVELQCRQCVGDSDCIAPCQRAFSKPGIGLHIPS